MEKKVDNIIAVDPVIYGNTVVRFFSHSLLSVIIKIYDGDSPIASHRRFL